MGKWPKLFPEKRQEAAQESSSEGMGVGGGGVVMLKCRWCWKMEDKITLMKMPNFIERWKAMPYTCTVSEAILPVELLKQEHF